MYETTCDAPSRDTCRWAMLCHLGGLARFTFVPFGGILVPLVIWLLKRTEDPYIDEQGRESLNFQMSMTLYNFIVGVAMAILWFFFLGFLLWPVWLLILLVQVGGCIYGAIQANTGEEFQYPFTIRFLS